MRVIRIVFSQQQEQPAAWLRLRQQHQVAIPTLQGLQCRVLQTCLVVQAAFAGGLDSPVRFDEGPEGQQQAEQDSGAEQGQPGEPPASHQSKHHRAESRYPYEQVQDVVNPPGRAGRETQ